MIEDQAIIIAGNIRALCAERRIRQAELADLTGRSYLALRNRLAGRVPLKLSDIQIIAAALNVPAYALLRGTVFSKEGAVNEQR